MLSTKPPKWTQDRYPQEFQIRKYIFDTWRKVCTKFWYQEYLWPLVESAEIWKAKSWEDVWWSELTMITNRDWEISELALRPEMTPTVSRMVSKVFNEVSKPIKYFSIANFYRNERPQRGRNREFWQLNVDIFGSDSIYADIEILVLAMSIMLEFDPPKNSWKLNINNRFIIDDILKSIWISDDIKQDILRTMDKWEKLPKESITDIFIEKWLNSSQVDMLVKYMDSNSLDGLLKSFPDIKDSKGINQTQIVLTTLSDLWYSEYLEFKPSLIRWFDYYNWVVFEIFDIHPENKRALFWWWRYNWLSKIFIKEDISATGFAPWDETLKLFLESWWLIDNIVETTNISQAYFPILDESLMLDSLSIAKNLRSKWYNIFLWFDIQKLWKAMQQADKQNYDFIVIFWEDEKKSWKYKIKNLKTWEETSYDL